ncbi:unnamed protein product, partial [Ectocarpus sp. 12 AP-2014]
SHVIETKTRTSTARVAEKRAMQCLGLDQEQTEPGFCRWIMSAIDLDVSVPGFASVLSDVTALAVRLPDPFANIRIGERSKQLFLALAPFPDPVPEGKLFRKVCTQGPFG